MLIPASEVILKHTTQNVHKRQIAAYTEEWQNSPQIKYITDG